MLAQSVIVCLFLSRAHWLWCGLWFCRPNGIGREKDNRIEGGIKMVEVIERSI